VVCFLAPSITTGTARTSCSWPRRRGTGSRCRSEDRR
jgi:hypothetical protein